MTKRITVTGRRFRGSCIGLIAVAAICISAARAAACDKCSKDDAAEDLAARLVGDHATEAELNERLEALETRLRQLTQEVRKLSDTLERARRGHRDRHDGDHRERRDHHRQPPLRSHGPRDRGPDGFTFERYSRGDAPRPGPDHHRGHGRPHEHGGDMDFPARHHDDDGAPSPDMGERFRDMQHRMKEEWREQQRGWKDRQADLRERMHERHGEMTEQLRERQTELAERFAERMREWGERQEMVAEKLREEAQAIRENAQEMMDSIDVDALKHSVQEAEESVGHILRGISGGEGSRDEKVYDVTGEHANRLFELLAPESVKVIVSREGDRIAIRGTDREHAVLNSALQLLNWVDRDDSFAEMTRGERTERVYRVGRDHADMLFEMLAPSDVKVVVSRRGDAAVSISATKREHRVLSDFLKLLHWTDGQNRNARAEKRRRGRAEARHGEQNARARDEEARVHAERKHKKKGRQNRVQSRGRSGASAGADAIAKTRVVYDVTGDHADQLFDLLAPANVKVVVSRTDDGIAVRGSKKEHAILRNALQLLNWSKRGKAFQKMTRGERTTRKYRLGEEHAEQLFKMLAPDDVKVIVSRLSDDTLTIHATPAEHKVLARFLKLLAWRTSGKGLKSVDAGEAYFAPPPPRRGSAKRRAFFTPPTPVVAPTAPVAPVAPMPPVAPVPVTAPVPPVAPIAPVVPAAHPRPIAPPAALFRESPPAARDRQRVVYSVTGQHADLLYKLLASSDVKPIVSRVGKHIAVRGSAAEQSAISNALELLNWIDRDVAFENMIQGERHQRTYNVGSDHAEALFDMLAPSDVKVIVGQLSGDTVSIEATDAEHKALGEFLKVLNWKE